MIDVKFKDFVQDVPVLLSLSGNVDDCMGAILTEIKKILNIENSAIYYFADDSSYLKYANNNNIFPDNIFETSIINKFESSDFVELQNDIFNIKNKKMRFFALPLMIREAIFGYILIMSDKKIQSAEVDILKSIVAIASYVIKDEELANVFKLQLRAMQSSVVDKVAEVQSVKKEKEKILEADKIKNNFLANISHELRTPLNAIIGFSEALNSKIFGKLNKKQTEYVGDIYNSGVHLLGMINEILDISKLEANAMKINYSIFDVQSAIGEVVRVMQPLADKKKIRLELILNYKNDVNLDYQKFQQIMYNLLGNAIKFTSDNGNVEISAKKIKNQLEIYVKDDGIGIEKANQCKIFDKFVQLENTYTKTGSSTGLGLTITKSFVEMMDGKIKLESEKGKGSKFICTFPLK